MASVYSHLKAVLLHINNKKISISIVHAVNIKGNPRFYVSFDVIEIQWLLIEYKWKFERYCLAAKFVRIIYE